ncbi:MAG: OmpA family protein [Methylococcaceae bacterium]|nr:OmpA family protein [Methylococcaceae bacterium]
MFKYPLTFLFVCLFIMQRPLLAVEYSADILDAFWETKSSKAACDLIQAIPNYGEAFFSLRPAEPLQFGVYQARNQGFVVSKASLSALPAPWRHEFTHLKNYPVYIEQRPQSQYLSVFGVDAEAMINVLLSTDFPTFTYVNTYQEKPVEQVKVTVSAVNFPAAYTQFVACRQQLLPYAMASLQDKVFYFSETSRQVNKQDFALVEKIVQYMQVMQDTNLVIVSDTQSIGNADAKLFQPRAKSIVDLLVRQGLNKSRITVQSGVLSTDLGSNDKIFRVHVFGPDALKMFWFNKGSFHLTTKEKQRLDLVAQYMQHQTQALVINSHTDAMGQKVINHEVTQKRGEIIKRYLQAQGVPEDKLIVRAYGAKKPVASNRTRAGQAKNRRVELSFAR